MRLFDSHTHLQVSDFDSDRQAVIARAQDAGLVGMLVLGMDVPSSEQGIALAETQPGVLAAVGCHPHEAGTISDAALGTLADLAGQPSVAAVGEIGLDFYRSFSPHDTQLRVLHRQLETAANIAKPVAIHCRAAHDTLFPVLRDWSRRLGGRLADGRPLGVMHYFSGDADLARRYVDLGFLIAIHCSVTYPKSGRLHEVVQRIGMDALVVETDSPYGSPQSRRGQRNEPAYVSEAVAKMSELRQERIDEIAEATTENALRLFVPPSTRSATVEPRQADRGL